MEFTVQGIMHNEKVYETQDIAMIQKSIFSSHTYLHVYSKSFDNFVELCNKYQLKVENRTKPNFAKKNNLICLSFWLRKMIIFKTLTEKNIFQKCFIMTSGICRISTTIDIKKNHLFPNYTHFYFILGIFVKIQKI